VTKIDTATRAIVRTVPFPAGSRPYMLRVTPDGARLWVQTAEANTNVILDAETLEVLKTTPTGRGPVTSAMQPGPGRYGIITHVSDSIVLVLDAATGAEVKRIDVGTTQANVSFTPDGATAFVSLAGGDEVAAIDMTRLEVAARIKTGRRPTGLVILTPDMP
jgi:YVTN family beta-propeller protein